MSLAITRLPFRRASLRYSPRSVLVLSFVFLSLGSAIYVSIEAVNYLLLYSTLSQIDAEQSFQVNSLHLLQSSSSPSSLELNISVRNPSGYSGLRITHVAATLYFASRANSSITLFQPPVSSAPNATELFSSPLGPDATDTVNILIPFTSDQTNQLLRFYNNQGGRVVGEVTLRIDIASFLESVTGTYAYTRMQEVPLSIG